MEKKIIKQHVKGQKHLGKTNWKKVISDANNPVIDNENPELIGKKRFQ